MMGNDDRTTINGTPAGGDATQVFTPAAGGDATQVMTPGATLDLSAYASDRTQMAVSTECPVCHTTNPPGETYCGDCGFLLSSAPAAPMAEEAAPLARLVAGDGREFPLNPGRNTVGRSSADVLLADATVSRQHAALVLEDGRCRVEDLGSTNGTKVNGQRLAPNEAHDLRDGDEVKFGNIVLRVALPAGAFAAAAEAAPVLAGGRMQTAEVRLVSTARLVAEDTGAEHSLVVGTTTVGRRAVNALSFPTDAYISGRHAEIVFDGGGLILTDVGSTNGTLVNGDRIPVQTPTPLHDGDLLAIGQQRLRVHLDAPVPAAQDTEPPAAGEEFETLPAGVGEDVVPDDAGTEPV